MNVKSVFSFIVAMCFVSFALSQSSDQEERDPNAPKNTIKIPGMEIYVSGSDEGSRMPYDVAKSACACKGDGWRLPTIGELQAIYSYKDMFGNFSREYYWAYEQKMFSGRFYNLNFKNGRISDEEVNEDNKVRCVWSAKKPE